MRFVKGSAFVIVTFLVVFMLLELALRAIDPPFFEGNFKSYDPQLGWVSKSDVILHRLVGDDHIVRYETNSDGFRDVNHSTEHGRKKRDGSLVEIRRIYVLGDSFSEAAQVNLYETFWHRTAQRLNDEACDEFWEAHNFGVGDYGTVQQWLLMKRLFEKRIPDAVVLQMFPLNDIFNNSIEAANIASNNDAYRPYLSSSDNYSNPVFLNHYTAFARSHSYAARTIIGVYNSRIGAWGSERTFLDQKSRIQWAEQQLREQFDAGDLRFEHALLNVFAAPDDQIDSVRKGWESTEAALVKIADLASRHQVRLIVLLAPHESQFGRALAGVRKDLPFEIWPPYAERRVENLLRPRNVEIVGLLQEFSSNPTIVTPYLDGHWNRHAHDLVSRTLKERMRPTGTCPTGAASS